jgi:hypothetical protein
MMANLLKLQLMKDEGIAYRSLTLPISTWIISFASNLPV